MAKKHRKSSDGNYHIGNKTYKNLVGSRAQVWHETAYKTSGDLKKDNLVFTKKDGRVKSKSKHLSAKKEQRLKKHGYTAKKGKFGAVKIGATIKKSRKSSRRRRR